MAEPLKEYAGTVPDGKRPLTINIDIDLHRRLKVGAALLNSNMGAVIETLVDAHSPVTKDGVPVWSEPERKRLVSWLGDAREADHVGLMGEHLWSQ